MLHKQISHDKQDIWQNQSYPLSAGFMKYEPLYNPAMDPADLQVI